MAGDWMKVDLDLPEKPEVHQIAALLGVDADLVVGKLFRVWAWFDRQTEDGHAPSVTLVLIDRLSGHAGFGEAMQQAGWLRVGKVGVLMPNFDRHNGESAKKRALAAKRKSRQRHANSHAVGVTKTGPEKRREYKGVVVDQRLTTEQGKTSPAAREALGLLVKRSPERQEADEATIERHREAARQAVRNGEAEQQHLDDNEPF